MRDQKGPAAGSSTAPCSASEDQQQQPARPDFACSFPGCKRRFSELWKLRKHYRSPSQPGCGARGHDSELRECPRCLAALDPKAAHVGCTGGLAAPQQAAKRRRYREAHESYKLRRCASTSPSTNALPAALSLRSASEAAAALPPARDLLASLPAELRVAHTARSRAAVQREPGTAPPQGGAGPLSPSHGGASTLALPSAGDQRQHSLPPLPPPTTHAPRDSVRQQAANMVDFMMGTTQPKEASPPSRLTRCDSCHTTSGSSSGGSTAAPPEGANATLLAVDLWQAASPYTVADDAGFGRQLSWQHCETPYHPPVYSGSHDATMLGGHPGDQEFAAKEHLAAQPQPLVAASSCCVPSPFSNMSPFPLLGPFGNVMQLQPPPMISHQHQQQPLQQHSTGHFTATLCNPRPDAAGLTGEPLLPGGMLLPETWAWDLPLLAADPLDGQELAPPTHLSQLPSFTDAQAWPASDF